MSAPHTGSTMSGMVNATLNDPVIIDVDGRPCWLFPGGELLPVVSGGDGPDGDGGDGGGAGGQGGDGGSGDGSGGDADASGSADGGDEDSDDADDAGDSKVEFTAAQKAEMGRRIAAERAKAKTAAEAAAKKAIEQAAERAKMDEADRLKAEKADAEKAAEAVVADTNARLVRAEAKVVAAAEGVDVTKVARFVKVLGDDLDDIEVDDDGEVDVKALKKAVKAALGEFPEFKATQGKGGSSGGDMNGNGGKGKATSLEDAVAARYA